MRRYRTPQRPANDVRSDSVRLAGATTIVAYTSALARLAVAHPDFAAGAELTDIIATLDEQPALPVAA